MQYMLMCSGYKGKGEAVCGNFLHISGKGLNNTKLQCYVTTLFDNIYEGISLYDMLLVRSLL